MKRLMALLLLVSAFAAACGNSVDPVANPTPTPEETPTPGSLSGTYNVTAAQATQSCTSPLGQVNLTFNVPTVQIDVTGSDFTPNWGFVTSANLSVPDPEHGTISGNDWTANYTYCDYDLFVNITTKHVATWTGTFNGDGTFDSTLTQKLRNETGNSVATCGAGETDPTVTADMMGCTTPGVSWAIHGVKQ